MIGNGYRIWFWKDHWCGPAALTLTFRSLFDLVVNKSEIVEEVWDLFVGRGSWKPTFARTFNDWEVDMVANFLNVLQKERVSIELGIVSWRGKMGSRFSVWGNKAKKVREICFPLHFFDNLEGEKSYSF